MHRISAIVLSSILSATIAQGTVEADGGYSSSPAYNSPGAVVYATPCGCRTCPCGTTSAIPLCINGVCKTAVPRLKRRFLSREQQVRFYTEPEGFRHRWRHRHGVVNTVAPVLYQAPSGPVPVQVISQPVVVSSIPQPTHTICENCVGPACGECYSHKRVRRPKVYRVVQKVKREHWWNRRRHQPTCTTASCVTPVVQVVSSAPSIHTPISTSLTTVEPFHVKSWPDSSNKTTSLNSTALAVVGALPLTSNPIAEENAASTLSITSTSTTPAPPASTQAAAAGSSTTTS